MITKIEDPSFFSPIMVSDEPPKIKDKKCFSQATIVSLYGNNLAGKLNYSFGKYVSSA